MHTTTNKIFTGKTAAILFIILFLSIVFSIIQVIRAATPNPGHSLTEVDFLQVTKTANATLVATESVVLASGSITLTLPTAVGNTDLMFWIKKIDMELASIVTIDANGPETIDGMLTISLAQRGESVILQSNGSNWVILNRRDYAIDTFKTKGSTRNQWYTSPNTGTALTTGAGTVNVLRAIPFIVGKVTTIDQMAINVTTAGAGGTTSSRVGIYADGGNNYPGELVVDAGAVNTMNATGVKTFTTNLPVTLDPGLYWLVYVHDCATTAPTMRAFAVGSLLPILGRASTLPTNAQFGWSVAFTYAALPNPFTAGGSPITVVPIWAVFVRISL